MNDLTLSRILMMVVELAIVGYAIPAVFDLFRGKGRHGDPARLVVMGDALLFLGFTVRWFLMPDNDQVWTFLYVMTAVWGAFTLFAMRAYGRDGQPRD